MSNSFVRDTTSEWPLDGVPWLTKDISSVLWLLKDIFSVFWLDEDCCSFVLLVWCWSGGDEERDSMKKGSFAVDAVENKYKFS